MPFQTLALCRSIETPANLFLTCALLLTFLGSQSVAEGQFIAAGRVYGLPAPALLYSGGHQWFFALLVVLSGA